MFARGRPGLPNRSWRIGKVNTYVLPSPLGTCALGTKRRVSAGIYPLSNYFRRLTTWTSRMAPLSSYPKASSTTHGKFMTRLPPSKSFLSRRSISTGVVCPSEANQKHVVDSDREAVYTTTSKELKDPTAQRLEHFWWHVWGSDLRFRSGKALAKVYQDISNGPTFVPLRSTANRWEGPNVCAPPWSKVLLLT